MRSSLQLCDIHLTVENIVCFEKMLRYIKLVSFLLFFVLGLHGLRSNQDQNQSKFPTLKKISASKYQFGQIVIDRKESFLEFNATTNQTNGLIEYALVHESGKTHESLFRTKVRPQIFHACLLLLKLPIENRFFKNLWSNEPKQIDYSKSTLKAEVLWETNGTLFSKSLEKFVYNSKNSKVLKDRAFIFTGSKKIEGTYLAEMSGSIIAVYADEEAVVNSTDHDSNNDDVWLANGKEMPKLEVPVKLRFLLPREE